MLNQSFNQLRGPFTHPIDILQDNIRREFILKHLWEYSWNLRWSTIGTRATRSRLIGS